MSHKNKKYAHAMIQHESLEPSPERATNLKLVPGQTTEESQSVSRSLAQTLTNNLGLIATIGAGCAAATFLIVTKTGRNLSRNLGTRTRDIVMDGARRVSNYVAERGSRAYEFLRGFPTPLPREEILEQTEFDEKIYQLQEHFKRPAA